MIDNLNNDLKSDLLYRLQKGDEEAFTSLFYQYKDKLFAYIYSFTKSTETAEDIIQDVFMKIWNNREKLSEIENLNAFLYRIAQNKAIDELRRFSRDTLAMNELLCDDENKSVVTTPYEEVLSKEVAKSYKEAVNHLPPQQQRVFILHKEQGRSIQEIADAMNISYFTVQSHMKRAMANMRVYLNENYPGLFIIIMAYFI
jgi:RNA polymerase sigma-70 factor (ECF subfamily)